VTRRPEVDLSGALGGEPDGMVHGPGGDLVAVDQAGEDGQAGGVG